MRPLLTNLLAVAAVLPTAQPVLVTPGSPCQSKCGNVLDSTSQADISCNDGSFNAGDAQIFKGCVQCETNSRFVGRDNETDVAVALCNNACANFINATIFDKPVSQHHGYQYCNLWPQDNQIDYQGCRECLAVDHHFLANFVTMLHAGCQHRPEPGIALGVDGDPFQMDLINITAPSQMANIDPAWFDNGPLNLGAKVGLAAGAFVLILIILGTLIVWNGKRRRRAFLRKLDIIKAIPKRGPAPQSPGGGIFGTPVSQRPLNSAWGDSPVTENSDKPFPRYVSPYSSQYNSPTSATDMTSMSWPSAALPKDHNIGLASGSERSGNLADDGKGKANAESYELCPVTGSCGESFGARLANNGEAPVLSHPGYGRRVASPTQTSLTQEKDLDSGRAI